MGLPTFSKEGVPTVILSRPPVFPEVRPLVLNQFIGLSDLNTIYAVRVGPPVETIVLNFEQLTRIDRENIRAFFAHPLVNYALNVFQYTGPDGVTLNVRFLEPQLVLPQISNDNVRFDIILTLV